MLFQNIQHGFGQVSPISFPPCCFLQNSLFFQPPEDLHRSLVSDPETTLDLAGRCDRLDEKIIQDSEQQSGAPRVLKYSPPFKLKVLQSFRPLNGITRLLGHALKEK